MTFSIVLFRFGLLAEFHLNSVGMMREHKGPAHQESEKLADDHRVCEGIRIKRQAKRPIELKIDPEFARKFYPELDD